MPLDSLLDFSNLVALVEFAGGAVIAAYALAALLGPVRTGNVVRARLLVIDGSITGLSIKLAATLLKTIQLHTWQQILAFAVILVLRTGLKAVFNRERTRIQGDER